MVGRLRANWLRFGAFPSPRAPPSTSLTTGHYPLAPRPTPHASPPTFHAPRSSGSAVDAARRAGYSTPHPAAGQHATKCYVFGPFREFGKPGVRRKLLINRWLWRIVSRSSFDEN